MNCKRGDVERYSGKGLHREDWENNNGNMWWNWPCWRRAVMSFRQAEICSLMAVLSPESFTVNNSSSWSRILFFNSSISSPIVTNDCIPDFIVNNFTLLKIICQSSKSRNVKSGSPNAKGMFKKTNALSRYPKPNGYQYQNRWKNWPLDDSGRGNQNAENTRFLPIMGVNKDVDSFLETCRNQLRSQSERQNCVQTIVGDGKHK